MFVFIILSLFPIIIGCLLWYSTHRVNWQEWSIGTIFAFLTTVLFYITLISSLTKDYEIKSGQIYGTTFYPEWVEKYTITHRDSDGNLKTSTHYRTHDEYWVVHCSLEGERKVSKKTYNELTEKFGNKIKTVWESKSGFYSGDHNIYPCNNTTGYFQPSTSSESYKNKVKSSPSLFSFRKLTPEENKLVFDYPECNNFLSSNRLLGLAAVDIDILEFDRMNTVLNRRHNVNIIMIGYENKDSSVAQLQEAKWIGGKRNDLVLCYGPGWSYVFGWTDRELVKKNIETILLNNQIGNEILSKITDEVWKNYKCKNFEDFDYLQPEIKFWHYLLFIIIMVLTQTGLWIYFHQNEFNKEGLYDFRRNRWRYR